MRVTKDHEERRNEILDTAQALFQIKGYKNCTVNDILSEVKIAKGTFYYYFKSKEEVLDAIVVRTGNLIQERADQVLEMTGISVEEKFIRLVMAMRIADQVDPSLLEEMHSPENALLHQKSLNQVVTIMAPRFAKVVEEGNRLGIFKCQYPLEDMRIFLAAILTLTDEGIFGLTPEEQEKIVIASFMLLDRILGFEEGTAIQMYGRIEAEQRVK